MKKISLEVAEQKLKDIFKEDKIALLEYNGYNKPCKIQCLKCDKVYKFAQYGNVVANTSKSKFASICKECTGIEKKKKQLLQSLKDKFPKEPIDFVSFEGMKKPATIVCLKCGYTYSICNASGLKKYRHLCARCFPVRYQDIQFTRNKFKNYIQENQDIWELVSTNVDTACSHDKIQCKCKTCGHINEKTMYNYIDGIGCWYCYGHYLKTTEDFKKQLQDDYLLISEYKGYHNKVLLKHSCGFVIKTTPATYINRGIKCPKCEKNTSLGEKRISYVLDDLGIIYEQEYGVVINDRRLRFDFYLPVHNLYIEFNGAQHYEAKHFNRTIEQFERQRENDLLKQQWAGDKLLVIPYTQYKNIEEILINWLKFND